MGSERPNTVRPSFHLPEDKDIDEEESSYLTHATGRLFEPYTFSSTDDDSSYSLDRLNSSDFFNAPEAAIAVPGPRVKRLSQEKHRGHLKSKSDEKETKRRLQAARNLKQQQQHLIGLNQEPDEQTLKKRPSKTESKLRNKSRSMERDDKNSPTAPHPTAPLLRSPGVDPESVTPCPEGNDIRGCISNNVIEEISRQRRGSGGSFRQRHGSGGSSRQRHGSGDSVREKDGESERKMFHKKFVLAMKLGRRAYKDREEKGRAIPDKTMNYMRQYSDIIYEESLFMALQAHRRRQDMEQCMDVIWRQRETTPQKIDLVKKFEFQPESIFVDDNVSELLNCSFNVTNDYLDNLEAAIEQVKVILESIDMLMSLFPTTKCMRKMYDDIGCEEFQKRISTLNMWLNNAESLISVIKSVGAIIGVEKMPCIPWPFVYPVEPGPPPSHSSTLLNGTTDSAESTPPTPQSPVDSEESPSNSFSKRKVTFDNNTPLSSSPSTAPSPYTSNDSNGSSKHMYMSTSSATIDIRASPTSFYRPVIDRFLRKTGLLEMVRSKSPPIIKPLLRAKYAIIKMEMQPVLIDGKKMAPQMKHCDVLPLATDYDLITIDDGTQRRESVDGAYLTFYDEFTNMKLPSLIPLYVFLARFPLDLTHESLRLRLEQHIRNPSLPIIRQVVHECSEAAKVAISAKQSYQYLLSPITKKSDITDEMFERYIERFNMDLKEILEVYFGHVEYGMEALKKEETPHSLKIFLEDEWSFSKEICPFITGGMAEASRRFCGMCSTLLQSIQNQLEQELDKSLFDNNPTVYSSDGMSSPQSDSSVTSPITLNYGAEEICTVGDYRQMLMQSCREIKTLFTQMREWASKALGFAKLLRKDLEIAAEFKVKVTSKDLMDVLQATHHFRVITPHTANYIIVVPATIKDDQHSLLALLDVTCGREDMGAESTTPTRDGYLLLINTRESGTEWEGEVLTEWEGEVLNVEPKTETTIALSHIGVDGLFLIVTHSSQLNRQRKEFCNVARDTVELINEQTTCHQAIAEAWSDLRTNALELASGVHRAIEHVENQLDSTDLESLDTDADRKTIKAAYKETLHQCYSFGFEFLQEFNRLNTSSGQSAVQKDKILLSFAHQWFQFVKKNCERGKGTRPRWANPGFDFLSVVIEPNITKNLDEEEFENLQAEVEEVVQHIIGESSSTHQSSNRSSLTVSNPLRFHSMDGVKTTKRQGSSSSSGSRRGTSSEPPTPYDRTDSMRARSESSASSLYSVASIPESPTFSPEMMPPDRSQAAVNALEHSRDARLREKHVIGRVTEAHHHANIVKFNVRKNVNFKWQRGTKIGAGQFGVVYTAVNCDTNCMMAMKELQFQPNDVQTIKSIADELKTFEGINHPNLVKYYGIEVHKEEIFIFMEYCNEGTLEDMSKIGLTPSLIRRYTREIVIAIEHLHEHNIIHRDIKGANIFLVSNDKLKLGDFGCSAKLKEHTTIPGEMVAFVGTTAFMAPEVITQRGYGRSADIWSLGCVVIEMATGKRPWFELDNIHQIMFKVGMGNIPPIPESFHQEGKDFLGSCFEVDPNNRSTANELLGHTFLKV